MHPGRLVNTAVPPTRTRVTRASWSTPRFFGQGPHVVRDTWSTTGPRTRTRAALGSWSTPRALESQHKSPRRAGRPPRTSGKVRSPGRAGGHRGPSGRGLSCPGRLVDTTGPPTRSRVPRDSLSIPWALRHGPESLGTAGRPLRTLDPGPRRLGQLVEHTDPRTRAKVAREGLSTPEGLGPRPKSSGTAGQTRRPSTQARGPGTAGRHRGPSDLGPKRNGQLVEPAGPRPRARVLRDSWSTTQVLGPGPKYPGQVLDPAGTRTRARVIQDSGLTSQ